MEYRHVLNQRLKEGAEYAKAVEVGAKREIFARRLPDIQIPDAYREAWRSSGELVRYNARRAVDAMANLINNDLGPGSLATESREIVSSADFGLLKVEKDDRSSELAIAYLGDRLGFYGDDVDIKSIGGNRMSEIQLNDSSGGYVIVDILEESYPGTVRDAIELYPARFDLDGSHSVVFPPNNTAAGSYVDRTSIMRLGGDNEVESIAVEALFDPGMHQVIPVIPLSKLLPAS